MLKDRFRFKYVAIITVAVALILSVFAEGILSADTVVSLPENSVHLLADGKYNYSYYGYSVNNQSYTVEHADPSIVFDDINTEVNYIYLDFGERIVPRMAMQVFYTDENMTFSESNATAQIATEYFADYAVIKVDGGYCEDLRLDLDGNFVLEDVVVSDSAITPTVKLFHNFSFLGTFVLFAGIAFMLIAGLYILLYHDAKYAITLPEKLFVLACFVFYGMWIFTSPSFCPDESMRFDVSEFLFENNRLPVGTEAANPIWGFSYALLPTMLCNILDFIPMKLVSVYSDSTFFLLLAARLVSVTAATATVYYVMKTAKLLFKAPFNWIPVFFVAAIPQFAFLGSYVNNDIIALLGISIILYTWTLVMKENWDFKTCFMLCVGMSVCALSYYNSYTWILASMLFYFVSYFKKNPKDFKGFVKFSSFIVIVTLAFISYLFLRHVVLYHDLLGFNISHEYGELYGSASHKPSARSTPSNLGYSLSYMLFDMKWIISSYKSFVGVFGYMNTFLRKDIYFFYLLFFAVAFFGLIIGAIYYIVKRRKPDAVKAVYVLGIIGCTVGAVALSLYYSYFDDFQAQGRYCYPALPALAMLIGFGFYSLFRKLRKEYQYASVAGICVLLAAIDIDALLTVLY